MTKDFSSVWPGADSQIFNYSPNTIYFHFITKIKASDGDMPRLSSIMFSKKSIHQLPAALDDTKIIWSLKLPL